MITRANCHFQKPDVYCGRQWKGYKASILGNPFKPGDTQGQVRDPIAKAWLNQHIQHGTPKIVKALRDGDAIALFQYFLWSQIRRRNPAILAELRKIYQLLQTQDSVSLGCWCHEDYACHTDVIARAVVCPEVSKILEWAVLAVD